MRILRAGHAACAEAPRDSQGVAAAAVPAAMKRRRLIFTDIDSLPEFSGSVAHRPATATCEGRDRLAQLPTLAQAHQRHEWHWRLPYSERWKILQPPKETTPPSAGNGAYENYCCRDCNCNGARACTLACVAGAVDAGLRAGAATGRGGLADVAAARVANAAADVAADVATDVLGRRFCSDTLAITRAICSWFALSCSAVLALSRANSAWLALSCSISCCALARSRAIVWSNCACSAAAASCGAV